MERGALKESVEAQEVWEVQEEKEARSALRKVRAARVVLWLGMALVVGPGGFYPNAYDMVFLVGGVLVMAVGLLLMLATMRRTRLS